MTPDELDKGISAVERSVNRLEGFVAAIVVMVVTGFLFTGVRAVQECREVPQPQFENAFRLLPPDPFVLGDGERVYLLEPERIVQAIRQAEGVPSHGSMRLARQHGGHRNVPEAAGRADAARLVHASYRRWRAAGRPGDFLAYLHSRYAPVDAANDPTGLNRHWKRNVVRHLEEASR